MINFVTLALIAKLCICF